jgi:hypothetical protein
MVQALHSVGTHQTPVEGFKQQSFKLLRGRSIREGGRLHFMSCSCCFKRWLANETLLDMHRVPLYHSYPFQSNTNKYYHQTTTLFQLQSADYRLSQKTCRCIGLLVRYDFCVTPVSFSLQFFGLDPNTEAQMASYKEK